jgi:hypothetical protein
MKRRWNALRTRAWMTLPVVLTLGCGVGEMTVHGGTEVGDEVGATEALLRGAPRAFIYNECAPKELPEASGSFATLDGHHVKQSAAQIQAFANTGIPMGFTERSDKVGVGGEIGGVDPHGDDEELSDDQLRTLVQSPDELVARRSPRGRPSRRPSQFDRIGKDPHHDDLERQEYGCAADDGRAGGGGADLCAHHRVGGENRSSVRPESGGFGQEGAGALRLLQRLLARTHPEDPQQHRPGHRHHLLQQVRDEGSWCRRA